MSGEVAELSAKFREMSDPVAESVSALWDDWNNQRDGKKEEWQELRNFIFATDTSTTTVDNNGWKNSTTFPKICQIRDNIHANYMSTLFPNRNWLQWKGDTDTDQAKAPVIEAYVKSIIERTNFYNVVGQLLYDYIDYGRPYGTVSYVVDYLPDSDGGFYIGYEGPKAERISPYDIVFNPTAKDFDNSPKIIRSIKSYGEIKKIIQSGISGFDETVLEKMDNLRNMAGTSRADHFDKAIGISLDGFGDMYSYLGQNFVEVLEFLGDYHDTTTGELYSNVRIIVVDRTFVAYFDHSDSWLGRNVVASCAWRDRPDNLYGMGPLDNLVGMQYRIDHLENLKADAMDLTVHPPIAVYGEVEPFVWGPEEVITIPGGDGKVEVLNQNLHSIIAANNEIEFLENKMEAFAGAPRNTMGIRTPGEKTAYEVQTLQASAGRIFQEKVSKFEREVLEPMLNMVLAVGRERMGSEANIRVFNSEFDLETFATITREDINGNGTLRPVGARHFAEKAITVQNVTQLFNSRIGELIIQHTSTEKLSRMMENLLDLDMFGLFRKDQGLVEQSESRQKQGELQQIEMERAATPITD